ncbi:SpoIIE family protein phosphatase [Cellulomonas endophytica]|uniref:SpoIIE family protein phosphatase n=1 Tax=Cellulomonas endophytica TaxID=2494735 RepID=UPI001011E92E|nr:SpoIIE family protein phosphatase [Cellulomonas endophytica]
MAPTGRTDAPAAGDPREPDARPDARHEGPAGEPHAAALGRLAARLLGAAAGRAVLDGARAVSAPTSVPGSGGATARPVGTSAAGAAVADPVGAAAAAATHALTAACAHVVAGGGALVVPAVGGTADGGAVAAVAVLAVPVRRPGGPVLGALAVADPAPRAWTEGDVRDLTALAEVAAAEAALGALGDRMATQEVRWQLATAAGGVGSFDWDLVSGHLAFDDQLLALFGFTRETFDGTIEAFEARLHPEDRERVRTAYSGALDQVTSYEAEYRVLLPDGAVRWIQARGRALPGAGGGAVRLVGAAYDTSATRDSDVRVRRLLETMSAAFFSLDPQWRFSYVNAEAERLLGRGREELLGEDLWELYPAAVGSDFEVNYRGAALTGTPRTFEAYYPPPLDEWYEVRAWPSDEGLSVFFQAITVRRRAESDALDAQRAAELAARRAERAAQRLSLLATVSADLTGTLDTDEAVARLGQHLVPALGEWCIVTLVDEHGALRDIGSWHADPDRRELVQRYRRLRLSALDPGSFLHRSLQDKVPVAVVRDTTARIAGLLEGEARDLLEGLAPAAAYFLPLQARGRVVGLVSLFRGEEEGELADDDFLTVTEVADRAGLAIDNARLYEGQHRIAESLQRSLLSAPVEPDHVEVVVRYTPAAEAAQVGGDWYDAFLQPDGATVLVIGDVMGHDSDAAAAMSQVRTLLRGIAYATGQGPAAVLTGLDAAMRGLSVGTLATAVVARLEQTADERERHVTRLRWSNAGHLPPMVLHPDGTVADLPGNRPTLLLGIDPSTERTDAVITVEGGSTVLLYTDGLVERRGDSLRQGMARLRAAVTEVAAGDGEHPVTLEALVDGVLHRMVPERPEDDVALVAVRLHREDVPRPPEAGPQVVPRTPPVPLP